MAMLMLRERRLFGTEADTARQIIDLLSFDEESLKIFINHVSANHGIASTNAANERLQEKVFAALDDKLIERLEKVLEERMA